MGNINDANKNINEDSSSDEEIDKTQTRSMYTINKTKNDNSKNDDNHNNDDTSKNDSN